MNSKKMLLTKWIVKFLSIPASISDALYHMKLKRAIIILCLCIAALMQSGKQPRAWAGSGSVNSDGTIDITINFRFPPTAADITDVRDQITDASQLIWDATEGQLLFGDVVLTCGSVNEDLADMWLFADTLRSGGSVYTDGSALYTSGMHINQYLPSSDGIVMAHEFGHLAFGLLDEYDEQSRVGACWGIGPCIETGDLTESNQCLMQQSAGFTQSEFCTAGGHDTVVGDGLSCADSAVPHGCTEFCELYNHTTNRYETTQQTYVSTVDCWTHLENNFSFLTAPAGLPVEAAPAGFVNPNIIENCDATDTVMLVLDRSESMAWNTKSDTGEVCDDGLDNDGDGAVDEGDDCTQPRIEFVKAAARAWLALACDQGVRAGIISFSTNPMLDEPFQEVNATYLPGLNDAVRMLEPGGLTGIGEALRETITAFAGETTAVNKTAFLISDGCNTTGPEPETVIEDVRDEGIRVFTISTGEASDDETLGEIAGATLGSTLDSRDASKLVNAFAQQWARYRNIGALIPILPYAINAEGPGKDDFVFDPNDRKSEFWGRRARVWSLGQEALLVAERPEEYPTNNIIEFLVEPDTGRVSLILAGNMGDMRGFGLRTILQGPSGPGPVLFDSEVPDPLMRVVRDGFFLLVEINKPNPGRWSLELMSAPGARPTQTGNLTLLTDAPQTEFFTSLDRYVVKDRGRPLNIFATPIFSTSLRRLDIMEATVLRPDGTQEYLTLSADEFGGNGDYSAQVSNFPMPGLYEVRLLAHTGPSTFNDPGESIWAPALPASVPVPELERTATEYFFVTREGAHGDCIYFQKMKEGPTPNPLKIDPFTFLVMDYGGNPMSKSQIITIGNFRGYDIGIRTETSISVPCKEILLKLVYFNTSARVSVLDERGTVLDVKTLDAQKGVAQDLVLSGKEGLITSMVVEAPEYEVLLLEICYVLP